MTRVVLPESTADAARLCAADEGAAFKCGGSDVMDRVHGGFLAPSTLVQLRHLPALRGIRRDGNAFVLGAATPLADVAAHPELSAAFPLLHASTDHTATPQIRNLGSVGGALCQRPRCWYLRHPDFDCRKKGGFECFAMSGDSTHHAIFDNDGCMAVHPSTLGAALLALDASLDVRFPGEASTRPMTAAEFFTFDMQDTTRENALPHGALVEAARIPVPARATKQSYQRASARLLADWAAVEACVNLAMDGGRVVDARVVLGAVSRVPVRARAVEDALRGRPLTVENARTAASHAADGAKPSDFNRYKVQLACNTVEAALLEVLA